MARMLALSPFAIDPADAATRAAQQAFADDVLFTSPNAVAAAATS
jgi:uroporphyrinogen-III synthase